MKRSWVVLVALGGLLAATLVGPRLLRGVGFFRVSRVEIVGVQYLAPATLVDALKLSATASVFDDPAPLARRALAVPGVRSAVIRRRMPGTLEVVIEEAAPVALAPGNGGLVLIDARGKVLPFDPVTSAPDLPVAVEFALMRRWYKGARAVYVDQKLVPAKPVYKDGKVQWVHDKGENET